jgi:hypothetical protein
VQVGEKGGQGSFDIEIMENMVKFFNLAKIDAFLFRKMSLCRTSLPQG